MKITCPYCGNLFNDTLEKCPNCAAPNTGVVRTSGDQPVTIEELKAWYESKALPSYETTRFFIGEDYSGPRAFGIYQDERTGDFVVYKNKDTGKRAIRYQGTDEAYAVNELYQRLKQEIIQQKQAKSRKKRRRKRISLRIPGCSFVLRCLFSFLLFLIFGLVVILVTDAPADGYYRYEQTDYYHYAHQEPSQASEWFTYDLQEGEWKGPLLKSDVPYELGKNKRAKAFYVSADVPPETVAQGFLQSDIYRDAKSGYTVAKGYYHYDDTYYYHVEGDSAGGWYRFDVGEYIWYESSVSEVPAELQRASSAEDFFYTPTWDSSTQITDFTDTQMYEDHMKEQRRSSWDDNDDDDSDYSWDWGDSWDSGSTDWSSDW